MAPPQFLYNRDSLGEWHSLLENVNKILTLNLVGDSITSGTGTGVNTTLPYKVSNYLKYSWAGRLTTYLQSRYGDVGWGLIPPSYQTPPNFVYSTFSEGWVEEVGRGMMSQFTTTTPGSTITIPFIGTGIRIFHRTGPDYATITTQIDSEDEETHTPGSSYVSGEVLELSDLEEGTHSVVITHDGGEGDILSFQGHMELNNETTGVRVNRISRPGASATNYFLNGNQDYDVLNLASSLNPDLTILCLGVNDYLGQYISYFPDKFEYIVSSIITDSPCLVMIPPTPQIVKTIPWSEFRGIMYDVANEYNCAILDIGEVWGDNYTSYQGDGVHPNYSGHIQIAGYLNNCLVPNSFKGPRMNIKRFERMFRR